MFFCRLLNSKICKIYLCFVCFCLLALAACDSADSAESMDVPQLVNSSIPPSKGGLGDCKTVPLYDGVALMNTDGAIWWVSRQMVFTVNEKAMDLSPLSEPVPSSINEATVLDAFANKLPPMPAHLEIPYAYADALMKAVYEQYGLVPEHPTALSWVISDGDIQKGHVAMEEFGGLITRVTIHVPILRYAEGSEEALESYNRTPVQVLLSGLGITLKNNDDVKEVLDRCYLALLKSGDGAVKSTVKNGKRFIFTRLPTDKEDTIQLRLVIEPRQ